MTLTALRRIVLLGSVVSLGAAGGAAWFALDARAEARPGDAWTKAFPVKAGGSDPGHGGPETITPYMEATRWPQGEIPPKVDPNESRPVEVKVDPFESKYRLNTLQVGSRREDSFAQLKIGADLAFSVPLGGRIPDAPGDSKVKTFTPWRLEGVEAGGPGTPARALFRHIDTGEEKTLSAVVASGQPLPDGGNEGRSIDGATAGSPDRPPRDQQCRVLTIKEDRVKGEFEYRIPEEEQDWLEAWSDDEVRNISTEESRDAAGRADGFKLKAVPSDSRAYDMGFRQEDKIISVNGETVTSTADALAKGRSQYDAGAAIFQIKGIRKGKEVTFTFHAPKKNRRK